MAWAFEGSHSSADDGEGEAATGPGGEGNDGAAASETDIAPQEDGHGETG